MRTIPTRYMLASALLGTSAGLLWHARREQRRISFQGATVLITGGSRGLGLVLARQLADEGANLAIMARDADELLRAAQELSQGGAQVLALRGDVRDQQRAEEAVEKVIQRFGRIDVLINNAGVIQTGPIEHMTTDDFEEALAVHLRGPLYTMFAAVPYMRQQGHGRIVNIASIGGKVAVPHLVPYTTSKFALAGLSDGMRAELAKDNILVTTVFPGLMRTGSHMNALFKGQHQKEFTWFSLIDALPITSINARRAAAQIIEACRYGQPSLVISLQAQLIAVLSALLPNLTAEVLQLMNRMLPAPTSAQGDETRTGWQSQSSLAPSLLTRLADQASEENNGLAGHAPIV